MGCGNSLAVFLLAALLLAIAGCTGKALEAPENSPGAVFGMAPGNDSTLAFPDNGRAYVATYVMDQGGSQAMKKVYVMGDKRRVDFLSEDGMIALSAYFLDGRAYSCSSLAGAENCYDITDSMGSGLVGTFAEDSVPQGGQEAGAVDIGGTTGTCYLVPYSQFSKRKMCYTDRGVLAYDEYNESRGEGHVMYATKITYYAKESDFALPSEPKARPA